MANNTEGIMDQFPFPSPWWISLTRKLKLARPCFLCNLFKTLHAFGYLVISKNYVKIKLYLLIHGMYSFQSFVFDFVWFPSAAQRLCKGFYAFTSHVLNTLRQHIWCSHFFSNVCTWKPHSGIKQCVFSLRAVQHFATTRKEVFSYSKPMFSDWLDNLVPGCGAPLVAYLLRTFANVVFSWK